MKWKQHFDKPFSLYHLSERCLDGETFFPRPMDKDRAMEGENWRAKRICVSTSIDGALSSLVDCMCEWHGVEFYVHVPSNLDELFKKDKVYKPSTAQVPDAEATGEHWLKAPALWKCIGKVKVTGIDCNSDLSYMWDGMLTYIDRFEWTWIEKLDLQLT